MDHASDPGDHWVRRRLAVGVWRAECAAVAAALGRQSGVDAVETDAAHARVTVRYDVRKTDLGELEAGFAEAGCPLAPGRMARLRRALYRYLDENARANARHRPAPCCADPSDLYTRKHK